MQGGRRLGSPPKQATRRLPHNLGKAGGHWELPLPEGPEWGPQKSKSQILPHEKGRVGRLDSAPLTQRVWEPRDLGSKQCPPHLHCPPPLVEKAKVTLPWEWLNGCSRGHYQGRGRGCEACRHGGAPTHSGLPRPTAQHTLTRTPLSGLGAHPPTGPPTQRGPQTSQSTPAPLATLAPLLAGDTEPQLGAGSHREVRARRGPPSVLSAQTLPLTAAP